LDLAPDVRTIINGKPVHRDAELEWGPAKCFAEDYLYSSKRFSNPDELEKFLFGPLDNLGAKGLKIVEDNTWEQHGTHCVSWTLEFFDALKLRTPKGLDWLFAQVLQTAKTADKIWIASQNRELKREVSLISLEQLRLLNTTTWWEAVWEIVTCKKSELKFICSDHPVTMYNPAFFPMALDMRYPNEPSILLRGTRTLIPLSLDSCLIITNLEYAREPGKKMSVARTNARYFGRPKLFDIRSILRGRDLDSEGVAAINFIVKRRAKRYIAAASPEWLHPERALKVQHWSKLDTVLLPDRDKVAIHHGGEFFWGNDKWMTGADEFGRPVSQRRIEEAVESNKKIRKMIQERRKAENEGSERRPDKRSAIRD
jgi:hypothetical protein